jgi:hypothetical protein
MVSLLSTSRVMFPGQGLDEDLHLDEPGPADEAQGAAAPSCERNGRGEECSGGVSYL